MSYTNGLDNPELYFQTVLWSGDSSSPRTITFDGSENMQPDWIWTKKRDGADHNQVYDSVRGFGAGKDLCSGQNFDEGNAANGSTALGFVSSATSDGFVLTEGNHGTASIRTLLQNITGKTYVGWGWKAGTSFTNDASSTGVGSIDSAGSVNTNAGFSITSYTGTGSAATVAHGLGVAPSVYILKNRTSTSNWFVYHKSTGATKSLFLDGSDAAITSSGYFNNTEPTSSVFSIGSESDLSGSSQNMIAYCFAEKKGYSKFGSYTGNGNADGTFVYTGFKPAWVLIKQTSPSGEEWQLLDNKRNTFNPTNTALFPSDTAVENSGNDRSDFLSNGFKCRSTSAGVNSSSSTYIYMAFAESPFVNSNGVTNNAR